MESSDDSSYDEQETWDTYDFFSYLATEGIDPENITEIEIPGHVGRLKDRFADKKIYVFPRKHAHRRWLNLLKKFKHSFNVNPALPEFQVHLCCPKLKRVILPHGLQSIEDFAFADSGILTVDIPSAIENIGKYAFKLSKISKMDLSCTQLKHIEHGSFENCCNLETVILPDSVISIGTEAFSLCFNLTSISLPGTVNILSDRCFFRCDRLIVYIRL